SSAAFFFQYESPQPVSVTTPSLTATPISLGRTRESHFNSSRISLWISSSLRVLTAIMPISFAFCLVLTQSHCQPPCLTASSSLRNVGATLVVALLAATLVVALLVVEVKSRLDSSEKRRQVKRTIVADTINEECRRAVHST